MRAKFLILALVSVSLVQVRGQYLEDAIENAARKIMKALKATLTELDNGYLLQNQTLEYIDVVPLRYLESITVDGDSIKESLTKAGDSLKIKAEDSKDSESIIECIDRFVVDGANKIDIALWEFESALDEMHDFSKEDALVYGTSLERYETELQSEYTDAIEEIQMCEDASSIKKIVSDFEEKMENARQDIIWIIRELAALSTDFVANVNSEYQASKKQLTRFKFFFNRNIRLCYYNRNTGFAELLNEF